MSKQVVVDDTDAGIQYTGSWFPSRFERTDNVVPFMRTLSGTNGTAGFSYQFSGTSILVVTPNPSDGHAMLQCLVDNVLVNNIFLNGRVVACQKDGLDDGPHFLKVNGQAASSETFWFDYIQYTPSTSAVNTMDTQYVGLQDQDLTRGLSAGWNTNTGFPWYTTSVEKSGFSFSFTGVSLTWCAYYDAFYVEADPNKKVATYSIDGAPPVAFTTTISDASWKLYPYNQIVFQTEDLPYGVHTLQVEYNTADVSVPPLTLSHLIIAKKPVQNNTTLPTVPSTTPGASSFPTSSSALPISPSSIDSASFPSGSAPAAGKSPSKNGPIIGAIAGGVAVAVVILLFMIYYLRRRRQRKTSRHNTILSPDMFEPRPYLSDSEQGVFPRATNGDPLKGPSPVGGYASSSSASSSQRILFKESGSANGRASTVGVHLSPNTTINPSQTSHVQDQEIIELTPNGRVVIPIMDAKSQSESGGTGRTLQRAPTTYVQDEDSGYRLEQPNHNLPPRVEILPPSYTES